MFGSHSTTLPPTTPRRRSVARTISQFLFASLLVLLMLAGQGDASAQSTQAQISVTARAGFGDSGTYLIGEWIPVRVTLTNPAGGESLKVRVQIDSKGPDDGITTGTYALDVDLPSPSRKEVTLYTYSGGFTRRFQVKVLQGNTTIKTVDVDAEPFEPPSNMIVAVVSSDPSLLNVLKGEPVAHVVNSLPPGGYLYGSYSSTYQPYGLNANTGGLATVAHITLDDIAPLSQSLDSLGALILDDVDSGTLSGEQRASIEAWVSRGGTLIAAVRTAGADTTAGIANLLPVNLSGTRNVSSLSSLGELVATPLTTTGQVSIGNATLRTDGASNSRALAVQDGVPLVAVREIGLGRVIYMGLSPAIAPLKNWDGTLPLVKRLLADRPLRLSYGAFLRFSPGRGYYMGSLYNTYGAMFALPALDLPDPWLLAGFLLLYIIFIGPVNFIILRRMRRTELAWITVPVLVGLFSVVAYLLAYQSKGGELVSIEANSVNTYPGVEQATLTQQFGLFSPVRRTYQISLPAESVVTEMNSYGYYQAGTDGSSRVLGGNTTTISNVNINTWSLKGFVAEHTAKAQSPVETSLHLGDNIIIGTVKNRTNTPLQDVALVRGDSVRHLGFLAPGQQIDVRMDVSSRRYDNASPVNILPPPGSVSAPSAGVPYPYSGGQGNSPEQRTYNRKVELLSAALYPLLYDTPPLDMNVIVLAWGPSVPTSFDVEGHTTNKEELTVWADIAPITASGNDQAKLSAGKVPYIVYAPSNNPSWLPWNGDLSLPNVSSGPGPVPTASPIYPVTPTPYPGYTPPAQGVEVAPYADLQYSLPSGTRPDSLDFNYSIDAISTDGDIDLLAYNVESGKWDVLGTWPAAGTSQTASTKGTLTIPDPAQYVTPGGSVTIRLQAKGNRATLTNATLNLSLNEK
ncbi:MAG: hypothetical protein ABI670_21430 [Chloroflexota bacterium]